MNYIEPLSIFGIFFTSFYLIKKRFNSAMYLMLVLSLLLHKELFSFFRWDLLPIRLFMFAFLAVICVECAQWLLEKILKKPVSRPFLRIDFKNPYVLIAVTFWLVCAVSILNSLNVKASVLLFGFLTTVIAFFARFFSEYKDKPDMVEKFLKFYVAMAFIFTLFGYFQLILYQFTGRIVGAFWNVPGKLSRVGALFWDVNHYGAFLAALTPIAGVLFLTYGVKDKKSLVTKIYYLLATVSLALSLVITNSRSAWIMAFVSFVVFVLILLIKTFGRKGILILLLPILLAASALGLMYSQKSSPVRAFIKQYFHYRLDSFDSHMLLLRGAFEIFQTYPVLGGGYGSFFEHFSKTKIAPEFYGRDPVAITSRVPAHTIWGEALANTGGIGFGVYLLFTVTVLGTILYSAIKTDSRKVFLMCSAMFSVLCGWLVAGIFYSYNVEYFWIIWALFLSYAEGSVVLSRNFNLVLAFFSRSGSFSKVLIMSIAFIMIFSFLGTNHLIPWDEAIYAKIAKNMVVSGDYITQHWKQNRVWYEKPPLYMWFETILMNIFGFNGWAVRLPSAIAGLLTIFIVYKLAEKVFSKTAAFISAFSLLTTTSFLYYSRTGMLDITVTFYITLAYYLFYLAKTERKDRYFYLSGVSLGFALMTKGVVGGLGFFIILLSEIFSRNRTKWQNYFKVILSALGIALPWHLVMYRLYGQDFINNYIGYHVIDRASSAIEDKGNPVWWYLIVLKVTMRLWAVSFIMALPYSLYRIFKKDYQTMPFVLWFGFILILFSLAQSKLFWYIIPLYPAAAIINGYFIDQLLGWLLGYFKDSYRIMLKSFALYLMVVFTLIYTALNKDLIYTSDLTGSQARLMQYKETAFGADSTVYLDRVDLPLALYYLDGPFEIVDFSPNKVHRVPQVDDDKRLYLVTKKGRYSENVAGYNYAPTVVLEDGDWIFWYMASRNEVPPQSLTEPYVSPTE